MNKIMLLAVLALGGYANAQQQKNQQLKKKLEQQTAQKRLELEFYKQNQSLSTLSKGENSAQNPLNQLKQYYIDNQSSIGFFFEGSPYLLKNLDTGQIKSANVDAIHNGEIEGLSQTFDGTGLNIAVFDGGHASADHEVFQENGVSRVTNKETDPNISYDTHSTAVSGMIAAKDKQISIAQRKPRPPKEGNVKGILPKATIDVYTFRNSIFNGREYSVEEKLLETSPSLSNNSWGSAPGWEDFFGFFTYKGKYNPDTQQFYDLNGAYLGLDSNLDNVIYENPHMIMVKSAGNHYGVGPEPTNRMTKIYDTGREGESGVIEGHQPFPAKNCANGHDCIGPGSLAKNIIVVGATEKLTATDGRYTQASDVVKASYSSAGPRDDGGIKPDVVAVGSDIFYANNTRRGVSTYSDGSGTSFSGPVVTGIIGLWTQISQELLGKPLNAATAKTLVVHSAKEAGNKGPDAWYGWGFADAKAGAELLVKKSKEEIIFEEKTLDNGQKHEIILDTDGTEPLKVSISWVDPTFVGYKGTFEEVHNNRTSVLVNDLDLRITNAKTGQVHYPWKLNINDPMAPAITGDNKVDNVEQILIDALEAGTYKVEISHKGTLMNNDDHPVPAPQKYAIIATGYSKKVIDTPQNNLNVYPTVFDANTTKEVFINSGEKELESLSLYDMAGILLHTEKAKGTFHKMKVGSYAKGIYILTIQLKNSKENLSRRIMIQ